MYGKLILVRHGQSTYNEENRFTGWKDVDLTQKGINEAISAAPLLSEHSIDLAFNFIILLLIISKRPPLGMSIG